MINEEIWKPVVGFEGAYEVSNTGKVRSLDRYVNAKNNSKTFISGIIRKPQKNHKGYLSVVLSKHCTSYTKLIHRLVAEAFIPNPKNLPQVNHIDTDKTNNNVSNLEWVTGLENIRHAFANGCFKYTQKHLEASKNNIKKAIASHKIKVVQLIGNRLINIFDSITEASADIEQSGNHISSCCKHKRKTCGGYNWKYYDDFIKEEIKIHMNKVIISGNLTRDPEVRYTNGENANAVTRFSVACQRRFKNADGAYDVDFPNVVAWGKTAEFVTRYFKKGDRIEVVGELRTGNYVNKDGAKVYTTEVLASEVGFGGKNSNNGESTSTDGGNGSHQQSNDDMSWMNIPENTDGENLPF